MLPLHAKRFQEQVMARKVFFSFYYADDHSRIHQVINMGAVEGQPLMSGQQWEEVEKKGDAAVQKWIDDQMKGKTCLVCLVGTNTYKRRWVGYEIKKAWAQKLGVVGIRIHGLKDLSTEQTSARGGTPFSGWQVAGKQFDTVVTLFDPPGADSKAVYASISASIEKLVENAIKIRAAYS
jgi:antiphage defense system Thoeris ThsB-like protein